MSPAPREGVPLPPRPPRTLFVHWAIDSAVTFLVLVLVALFVGVSIWIVVAISVVIGVLVAPTTRRAEARGLAAREAARDADQPPGAGSVGSRAVPATVVLVHGAWHGAWCWEKVVPLLDAAGIETVTVDLPGHGDRAGAPADLYEAAAHVRAVLDGVDGPVVLCGHSYGGAVITLAAAGPHPSVRHLVYLAAILPEVGETVGATMPDAVPGVVVSPIGHMITRHDDGTMTIDPEGAVGALYGDCSAEDVAFALARLSPHSVASFGQEITAAAWHDIPSTYVVCTADGALVAEFQRGDVRPRDERRRVGHEPLTVLLPSRARRRPPRRARRAED